jgi:O-acetyl-ADP-ribose deacetylase (regulator of RNase III)
MKHQQNARSRTYQFGDSTLTLQFGNLLSSQAQVFVSSDDSYISMGGGISAAILEGGGETIAIDASKKVPAALGDIVVTSAGSLSAQYVFHAITIGPNPQNVSQPEIVRKTTRRCMQLLATMQLSSIAFPAIGTGAAGFTYDEVAACMADVIVDEVGKRTSAVQVTIFLFDRFGRMSEMDFVRYFEEFASRSPRIAERQVADRTEPNVEQPTSVDLATQTEEEYKRRRLHNLRKLLGDLEEQRSRLEQCLISSDATDSAKARISLEDNQKLRLQYLSELEAFKKSRSTEAGEGSVRTALKRVFVGSTYKDLIEYRTAVKDAVSRCDLLFRGMEHFGADPNRLPPATLIVNEVKNAHIYIGIFGVRYGYVDPATGLSMTELEFREAEDSQKPMLLYLMHGETSVPVDNIEHDPQSVSKLAALKTHISSKYVVYMFRNVDDLRRQVITDLERLKSGRSN